jgi:hypothetical protein
MYRRVHLPWLWHDDLYRRVFPSFTCDFIWIAIDTRQRFRRPKINDLSPPWYSSSRLFLLPDSTFPMDWPFTLLTLHDCLYSHARLCSGTIAVSSFVARPADFSRSFVMFPSPRRRRHMTERHIMQI